MRLTHSSLKHPGCVGIFVFDQSSAHNSHGEGALDAFGMNLGPGGAVEPQTDTYYPPEAATKVKEPQCLWTEELVEVVINDGKVEVVKAKTVTRARKLLTPRAREVKAKKLSTPNLLSRPSLSSRMSLLSRRAASGWSSGECLKGSGQYLKSAAATLPRKLTATQHAKPSVLSPGAQIQLYTLHHLALLVVTLYGA